MRPLPAFTALIFAAAVLAAEPAVAAGALIELSAEASRTAANDIARASVFMEAADANPGELAHRVNAVIAKALSIARNHPGIKVQTGSTWTVPDYGKNNRAIESWRMRSELLLESRDIAALSDLLGKLQALLGVGQISLQPAPETRKKAEDEALLNAVAAFRERAQRIADALGRSYRIKSMNIGGGNRPVYAAMRGAAAAMPIEAGDSSVSVSVSGQIELSD